MNVSLLLLFALHLFDFQTIPVLSKSDADDPGTECGLINYGMTLRKIPEMPEPTPEPPPDENMAFDFEISKAQFQSSGSYFVRLLVCNNKEKKNFTRIKVEKNNEGRFYSTYDVESDSLIQGEPETPVDCKDLKWTFYLPRGNDYDRIYLAQYFTDISSTIICREKKRKKI